MDKIDLEELERVAADYDRRKEAARTFEIENFGSTTEERARYLATLKYGEATKALEALRPLIARVRELERQRDWLILYAWIDTNAPCPYEMGYFDQKKICPCWTPYHDWEKAEDMSRDDWHDLLMEGVMTEEDKVNCGTEFCECLLMAAEHEAAKEAGE